MSFDALDSGWAKGLGVDRKQFDMFFDKMLDGFAYHKIILDKAGKPVDYIFLEVNHAFEKITGLKRERIIGKKVTEVLLGIEKDPANWIGVYGKVALTGEPAQFENHAEALSRWFKVVAYCPEKCYFVALFEDITDRKKAEDSLRLSEENYRHLLQHAPTAIYEIDYKTPRFKSVNDAMTVLTGYSREELLALNPADLLDNESQVRFQDRIRRGLAGEKIDDNVEYRVIVKGGRKLWVVLNVKLTGTDGKYDGALVVGHDVTERKNAEEALKTTLDRFYTTLSNMHGAILLVSPEGNVEFANQSFCDYFSLNESPSELKGLSSGEIIGKIKNSYLYPDREVARIEKIVAAGKPVIGEEVAMKGNRTRLRDFIPLSNTGESFTRLWHHMDITERKKAENTIRESEQRWATTLASIGDAVIATDISGKITFMNREAEKLTGWTLSEASQNL